MIDIDSLLLNIWEDKGLSLNKSIWEGKIEVKEVVQKLKEKKNYRLIYEVAKYIENVPIKELTDILLNIETKSYDDNVSYLNYIIKYAKLPRKIPMQEIVDFYLKNDIGAISQLLKEVPNLDANQVIALVKKIALYGDAIILNIVKDYSCVENNSEALMILTKGMIRKKNYYLMSQFAADIDIEFALLLAEAVIASNNYENILDFAYYNYKRPILVQKMARALNELVLNGLDNSAFDYIIRFIIF